MPDHHELLSFLLLLAVVIAAAKSAGWLSLRLGQPAVLGELLIGVVLGPSVIDLLRRAPFEGSAVRAGLFLLAELGVILLMFIAGLETDIDRMRGVGKAAVSAGVAGVVVPLVLGLAVALPFGFGWHESTFIGVALTATSVSITVQTLIELGQLDSEEGLVIVGSAVVDDVVALLVLSGFLALTSSEAAGALSLVLVLLRMVVFFAAALLGGSLLGRGLARAERAPVSEGLLAFAVVGLLAYAWAAEAVGGIAAITGAYLAGLLVARAGFRQKIEQRLKAPTYALLVPVFFVSIGLQTNARGLDLQDLPLALLLIGAAVVGKVIGCGAGTRLAGLSRQQSVRVGIGMISRGEVGLIIASLGLQFGLLPARTFAIIVIMVLATTVLTPPLLRLVYARRPAAEEAAVEATFARAHWWEVVRGLRRTR